MKIKRLREIILEEIENFFEAEGGEKAKIDKEKIKLAKQKQDVSQQKVDLQKHQVDVADRQADQRDIEADKKEKEKRQEEPGNGGEQGQSEPETKPNISFKDQGEYYEQTFPELRNFVLSSGNLLDDDEKKYVALAVQAAEGRMDKGFEKYLRKGKAGNVYGKDFSDKDINKIIEYCKENNLVR